MGAADVVLVLGGGGAFAKPMNMNTPFAAHDD